MYIHIESQIHILKWIWVSSYMHIAIDIAFSCILHTVIAFTLFEYTHKTVEGDVD